MFISVNTFEILINNQCRILNCFHPFVYLPLIIPFFIYNGFLILILLIISLPCKFYPIKYLYGLFYTEGPRSVQRSPEAYSLH